MNDISGENLNNMRNNPYFPTTSPSSNSIKPKFNIEKTFQTMLKSTITYGQYKNLLHNIIHIPDISIKKDTKYNYIRNNIFGNKCIKKIVTIQDCDMYKSYIVYFWYNSKNNNYYFCKSQWHLEDILGDYDNITSSRKISKINGIEYTISYTGILKYTFSINE
jgi:hypothetical protein